MKSISITVSGKVQGVFYRQSTKEKASELGITGQVSNLENGNVLIIATGPDQQLQQLIEWCKEGPRRAEVRSVDIQEIPLRIFEKFSILR